MNQGPMTGGRRGICTGQAPVGMGMGYWGNPCPRNRMGRMRGYGRQWGYGGYPEFPPNPPDAREDLARRAEFLQQELDAVKKALADLDKTV